METPTERILLVERDPQVREQIAQHTLQPLGYQVDLADSASAAIQSIEQNLPDLIITNLQLPEISGKDLLVALISQRIRIPIIVMTPKGHESDALQAFRLGAVNFTSFPIREIELVNVVEDTLRQLRRRNAVERDFQRLEKMQAEEKQPVQQLSEIISIGKLFPIGVNQQAFYEKLTGIAPHLTESDRAWLLVHDPNQNKYILRACTNADDGMLGKLNQPYEDSLSSKVAETGEVVRRFGEVLQDTGFPGSVGGIMIVPLKVKQEIIGMFAVSRESSQPFSSEQLAMLETLAEYASIWLENSRRYEMIEKRLFYLEQSITYTKIDSNLKNDILYQAGLELRNPLKRMMENLDILLNQGTRRFNLKQTDAINAMQDEADNLLDIADAMIRAQEKDIVRTEEEIDLNDVIRDVVSRNLGPAQLCQISIKTELPPLPTMVTIFASQMHKAIEGMISNAIKYSPAKSQITIRVERQGQSVLLSIQDQGEGISPELAEKLFDKKSSMFGEEAKRFGGIGISLPMIKEIISANNGEIWIESGYGKGFSINVSLPCD